MCLRPTKEEMKACYKILWELSLGALQIGDNFGGTSSFGGSQDDLDFKKPSYRVHSISLLYVACDRKPWNRKRLKPYIQKPDPNKPDTLNSEILLALIPPHFGLREWH